MDFFFLMLAIAAGFAGIASLLGFGFGAQIAVFAVVSAVLLLTLRPWARRFLANSVPDTKLNFQAFLGAEAVVETTVSSEGGRVRLAGDSWTAIAAEGQVFAPGETVYVTELSGASVVVSQVKP